MPRLPVVSGRTLVAFMRLLGYAVVRQRGSHIRLELQNARGRWAETVPDHPEIAKGTLRGIVHRIGEATGRSDDEIIRQLAKF